MAKKEVVKNGIGLPSAAMVVIGLAGALVSGLSFLVIQYWPLPVSVAPYFGFRQGALWGLVVGAVFGLILGFLTDDSHFQDSDIA
jgi:tetrahydromethanopterin S-methyltransferase subunit C